MSELERFESPSDHVATFETDELTARCPFDFGGPDHYHLTIRYKPDKWALESRSLKEFLQSYRDTEITAERLTGRIHGRIDETIDPSALYVRVEQARRGGIEETVETGDRELKQ